MKKVLYIALFLFLLSATLTFAFASKVLEVRNLSYNSLSFELYNKFSSTPSIPVLAFSEINQQVDQIPEAMEPYLKMVVEQMPKPKNGLYIKINSETYKLQFRNERDWVLFKRTALKMLSKSKESNFKSKEPLKQ